MAIDSRGGPEAPGPRLADWLEVVTVGAAIAVILGALLGIWGPGEAERAAPSARAPAAVAGIPG